MKSLFFDIGTINICSKFTTEKNLPNRRKMKNKNLKINLLFLMLCCGALCHSLHAFETRIVESVVKPEAIIWSSDTTGQYIVNPQHLLDSFSGQVSINNSRHNTLFRNSDGHTPSILLDFGKEIYGSVKIYTGLGRFHEALRMRVCMGESVSEAMSSVDIPDNPQNPTNEHSVRDFVMSLPWLGSAESGKSGFRFVRIDFIDAGKELPLIHVEARAFMRDLPQAGSFDCSDSRLTEIWNTGAYTVKLNMQDYVWDGIKRDRLVWLGDMHPEVMTIGNVWGDVDVVKKTLDFAKNDTPLPGWINDMSAYSLWWLIIQNDYHNYTGDTAYLREQLPYVRGLVDQIESCVASNGEEALSGQRFLDWPTSGKEAAIHSGIQSLTIMALNSAAEIGGKLADSNLSKNARKLADKMKKVHLDNDGNKQAAALAILSEQSQDVEKDAQTILKGGADGFSTFYGYYMLEALSKAGFNSEAQKIMSDYWGAMLDLGATTFWEDLDYNDVSKAGRIDSIVPEGVFDIHADGGAYCYKGLRLSLCHGWASGPTSWLTANVLGVRPIAPGCEVLEINPCLGELSWARGSFPTPRGLVEISVTKSASGKDVAEVKAPEGIVIINRTK